MSKVSPFKKAWIWCRRFRKRCGYGVHSPFAFNLITWVIYEKLPYYSFVVMAGVRKTLKQKRTPGKISKELNTEKVDMLLFRLINYFRPYHIIEIGTKTGLSTLYMASARKGVHCTTLDSVSWVNETANKIISDFCTHVEIRTGEINKELLVALESYPSVDFVHFNQGIVNREAFDLCLAKLNTDSVIVIEGIHNSSEMSGWWQELIADAHTGITFDLYDLGLIFFDRSKIKQHYIINF